MSQKACTGCGRPISEKEKLRGEAPALGACPSCGAQIDRIALTEFASRLARFGLVADKESVFGSPPEVPDAK